MNTVYCGSKAEYLNFKTPHFFLKKLSENPEFSFAENRIREFENSYVAIRAILESSNIPNDVTVVAEYGLKVGSFRIDYVLTGYDGSHNARAVVIELKQWSNDGVCESNFSNQMIHVNAYPTDVVHPCYQAWSYQIMLENYNASIQDIPIELSSCAYLYNYDAPKNKPDLLKADSFKTYLEKAELFEADDYNKLSSMLSELLKYGDNFEIYQSINLSEIRPSKALQNAVMDMMDGNPAFTLIDEQKSIFEKAQYFVKKGMTDGKKRLFLIIGGPGTGKSVIAINLMANLLVEGLDSSCFRSDERTTIRQFVSERVSKPKTKNHIAVYCPYVTKTEAPRSVYKSLMTMHSTKNYKWKKADVEGLFIGAGKFREKPQSPIYAGLIVDESHRLKDTDRFSSGTCYVENIIASAYTAIMFIDDKQRVSTEDFGTVDTIKKIASKNGYEVIEDSLSIQFRCGGSDEYISMIDDVLYAKRVPVRKFFGNYDFRVFDDPEEMHREIEKKNSEKATLHSRVLAGYCWNWVSKKNSSLFDINIKRPNGEMYSRKWNLFSSAEPFAIDDNSTDNVGCIHTSQGLEFEYAGVIIGNDLRLEGTELITDPSKRAKTDNSIDNRKVNGKAEIDEIIRNTYRVLLTRGQKGTYVYCDDKALGDYLKSLVC